MHYLSPEDGGAYLALRSAGRQWELPSWQKHYELKATDWSGFRETVREALEEGPLTIADLGTAVTRKQAYRHLRPVFDDGAGTLIKPLTWQGDMSLEASRNGKHTFQRLADNPRWAGMKGQLVAVDVEGETAYVVSEDVDPLMAARPTGAVRFLPGHDQWVIGSGTKDEHVVPAAHRAPVTRKANLVVASGVVSGTWLVKGGEVEVTWFEGNGAPPRKALEQQVDKLATLTGRPLRSTLQVV